MNCIFCHNYGTKVIDSRPKDGIVERRRECLTCHRRFTTWEKPISANPDDWTRKPPPDRQKA